MTTDSILEQSQLHPDRYTFWSRAPFLIAALGGGAFLLLLKWADVHPALVMAAAVILLLAYAAIVYRVPSLRLREDQLADNCYYLGFLFTLISLSWALWEFTQSGKEGDIVSNFGLALASTIVGILLRVTINQARKDVIETEMDARMALANSVVHLRVQIDDAVLAIKSFHAQTEQAARDAIQAAAERATGALDGSVAKVGETGSDVLSRIDKAFGEFAEHAAQLNTASAGTVRGLKSLLTRIEKVEAPDDIIVRRLEPALAAVAQVTNRLRDRLEADEALLADAETRSRETAQKFSAVIAGFAELQANLSTASQQSATAAETARSAGANLHALAEAAQRTLDLQKELADIARQQGTEANEAIRAHLADLAKIFERYNDTMALELERCRRMVAGTGNALAELAESIGDRLEPPALHEP